MIFMTDSYYRPYFQREEKPYAHEPRARWEFAWMNLRIGNMWGTRAIVFSIGNMLAEPMFFSTFLVLGVNERRHGFLRMWHNNDGPVCHLTGWAYCTRCWKVGTRDRCLWVWQWAWRLLNDSLVVRKSNTHHWIRYRCRGNGSNIVVCSDCGCGFPKNGCPPCPSPLSAKFLRWAEGIDKL